jgi:hypothetical protein
MKNWKKILLAVFGIALVAIACFISWSYGFRQGIRAGGLTSNIAEFELLNQHMTDQLANANCEGAKQALNDYLKHLEKYRDVKGSLVSDPTVYYGSKMLTHVRLGRIEEHMGNHAQAQKHMAMAKEACSQRKWEDCSGEKMVSFAKRWEEKNPIGCLSSKK